MRTNRNRIAFDGDLVRRYPLTAFDRADLSAIAARHEAAAALGLPVPRVLAVERDHLVLQALPGTPLLQTSLSPRAQARLGVQLAEVLTVLRATTTWPEPAVPWAELWDELAQEHGEAVTAQAAELAATITPTAVHGDLSGGNILVDDDGMLRAVIDWDGATLADPAQDFTALCANVAPGVADSVRRHTPDASELERRAAVYLATWQAQNLLWRQGRHPWLGRVVAEGAG